MIQGYSVIVMEVLRQLAGFGKRLDPQVASDLCRYSHDLPTMLIALSHGRASMPSKFARVLVASLIVLTADMASGSEEADRAAVAALDTEYQAAVKRNDAGAMQRIQHAQMILVLGDGRTFTGAELLQSARDRSITYERQEEDPGTQTVRVWDDTAVVTARLWVKGTVDSKSIDRRLWFSDTYVRTSEGWKYFFGQASLRLPESAVR